MELSKHIFNASADNLRAAAADEYLLSAIAQATDTLVAAFRAGKKVVIFGNGGSAADAQHICGELVGRFTKNRAGLPAISLCSDAAVLTCWANDFEYETVFERQVAALGAPGDVAWGISTSGNSRNVVNALRAARQLGLSTIAMTGEGGGEAAQYADVLIAPHVRETARVQEVHLATYHIICLQIENALFGDTVSLGDTTDGAAALENAEVKESLTNA